MIGETRQKWRPKVTGGRMPAKFEHKIARQHKAFIDGFFKGIGLIDLIESQNGCYRS